MKKAVIFDLDGAANLIRRALAAGGHRHGHGDRKISRRMFYIFCNNNAEPY